MGSRGSGTSLLCCITTCAVITGGVLQEKQEFIKVSLDQILIQFDGSHALTGETSRGSLVYRGWTQYLICLSTMGILGATIEVSNAVPDSVMYQNEAPPLIPSREPNNDRSKSSETPPPIPLKSYKHSA
ncbi:hypothetical protein GBAR_LOCUS10327 [Geodia barretti]|uniref:Uncharacterized protein n=1 Tax=Geodia barretti TaxID=519541 RepID=A0AA35RU46_GEOBA|nr:hypothetical protein GBAR_LOCUS10327 [Geodia barretti]